MFIPVLLARYAGIPMPLKLSVLLGHPFVPGGLLTGTLRFVVSVRVAVPLAMKRMRGSEDFSRRGTNVYVMMYVPVTLTSQDLFHISRMLSLPK